MPKRGYPAAAVSRSRYRAPQLGSIGCARGLGLKHEHLHGGAPGLIAAAEEHTDPAIGQPLDGRHELGTHGPLQDVALEANEVGLAGRDEVALGRGRTIFQEADDDVLLDERP